MIGLIGPSSGCTCQAILVYHALETAVYGYFVCMELLVAETKLERSLRFDSRVALLAYLMMGIPATINCFFGLRRGSWELVWPYQKYMVVTPVLFAVYTADLHLVSCGRGQCGDIHGFSVMDLALALVLHFASAAVMDRLTCQARRALKAASFEQETAVARLDSAPCRAAPAPHAAVDPKTPLVAEVAGVAAEFRPAASLIRPAAVKGDAGRGVLRLARGCETYEGTIRKFNEARGFGFVTSEASGKDIYFKISTCAQEIQAMGEHMVGTPVEFILRWMPDGTPQVRAMLQRKPNQPRRRDKAPLPLVGGVVDC